MYSSHQSCFGHLNSMRCEEENVDTAIKTYSNCAFEVSVLKDKKIKAIEI